MLNVSFNPLECQDADEAEEFFSCNFPLKEFLHGGVVA